LLHVLLAQAIVIKLKTRDEREESEEEGLEKEGYEGIILCFNLKNI
jgi:hypothetical protein